MDFDKDKLQEVLRKRQEQREYIESLDNKNLPYNDRVNYILDKLSKDVDHLIYRANEVGYINDDPYNDDYAGAFKEMYESLSKFMIQTSDNERVMIFRRYYTLYEFSELQGQGCELYLSKIQNENEYIDNLIQYKEQEISDIEYEITQIQLKRGKIDKQVELIKSFKEE